MLLKGNPRLSIFNIRLNYFQDLENAACKGGVLGQSEAGFRAGCRRGVAVSCPSLPGVSAVPALSAWAVLWSLGESIWPAKLAKSKPRKKRIWVGWYIREQQVVKRHREQLTTCEISLRAGPPLVFILSPQVMLLYLLEGGSFTLLLQNTWLPNGNTSK